MRRVFCVAVFLLARIPTVSLAQSTPPQPIVQLGFIDDWRPAITGGIRWTYTPLPRPSRDSATGMIRTLKPGWSLQTLASGGITFARPHGDVVAPTLLLQVGGLAPRSTGVLAGWGPTLLGSVNPHAIGPAIRGELAFHALGFHVGMLWFRHVKGPRLAVTADVLFATIEDIFKKKA